MPKKPKLPYLLFDAQRLDREFYAAYDERFLLRKVTVLGTIFDDPARLE